ncbi:hypothetical protein [Rhodanobacter sp. A1T4]|uniref:hypothetical protein n=1 Tax=Rhodanobacter sp. A1T4 TaxID=2723087 RepID=UPI001617CD04|nr:hypothetical protein [Rhodanobacter sp. A1T4]MBB6245696.1 hypothetical protein [Rhodanobacter sp. A1T4]
MTKPIGEGICVHCLRYVDKLTWDHVFPVSWYPHRTSPGIEMWKMPACHECNHAYGRMEENLLLRLAMCVDPEAPATKEIVQRALRAVDADAGRNYKDKLRRYKKRESILRNISSGDQISSEGIYPQLGERWGRPVDQQSAISVKAESFAKFAEKIVRGIVFIQDGHLIDDRYQIVFAALTPEGDRELDSSFRDHGSIHALEPGIVVTRIAPESDPCVGAFRIEVWGQFRMFVTVQLRA